MPHPKHQNTFTLFDSTFPRLPHDTMISIKLHTVVRSVTDIAWFRQVVQKGSTVVYVDVPFPAKIYCAHCTVI